MGQVRGWRREREEEREERQIRLRLSVIVILHHATATLNIKHRLREGKADDYSDADDGDDDDEGGGETGRFFRCGFSLCILLVSYLYSHINLSTY